MRKGWAFYIVFLGLSFTIYSQNIEYLQASKVQLNYKNLSDLIIIKASLNDHKNLNFILDTGSNGLIVFDSIYFNSHQLRMAQSVGVRGLGSDSLLTAHLIKNNLLKIHKKFIASDANVYMILDNHFSLGARFGMHIHGIIGNDLFRNYFLHLNYQNQKITIAKEALRKEQYQKWKSKFQNNKPFLTLKGPNNEKYPLLMDSGGVDAVWLFDSEVDWETKPYIRDFLGFGLSGEVVGNRIRKDSICFQNDCYDKMYVAVPDSIYTNYIKEIYVNRKGSVGGQFLKKYNWIIDYKNQIIYYKSNRNRKEKFSYNVTGMEVFQPIDFLRYYVIESVLLESASYKIGLRPHDVIRSINGRHVSDLFLSDIYQILHNARAKKMTLTVEREGHRIYFEIPIRDILNQ